MMIAAARRAAAWLVRTSIDWSPRFALERWAPCCAWMLRASPAMGAIGITLLELCGLVGARVIDTDGICDPHRPNDRLLLGMKGSIGEFELGVICTRMLDAKHGKALRGDLRIGVPTGLLDELQHLGVGVSTVQRVLAQPGA